MNLLMIIFNILAQKWKFNKIFYFFADFANLV